MENRRKLLLLLFAQYLLVVVTGQQQTVIVEDDDCKRNEVIQKTCVAGNGRTILPASIECPLNHQISIISVLVEKGALFGRCPAGTEEGVCVVTDVTNQFRTACNTQRTCSVTPTIPNNNQCSNILQFPGGFYIKANYTCLAIFNLGMQASARAIALCTNETFTGTNIHIDSDPFVGIGVALTESDCTCSVIVPPNIELDVRPILFFEAPDILSTIPTCAQRIEIWEGSNHYNVCSGDPVLNLGCSPTDSTYNVRYVTDDPTVGVGFVISLIVHHDDFLTVTCGENFVPTATPTEITTDSMTTPIIVETTSHTITTTSTTTTTLPPTTTSTSTTSTSTTTTPPSTTTTTPPTTTTTTPTTTTTIPPTTISNSTSTTTTTTAPTSTTPASTSTTSQTSTSMSPTTSAGSTTTVPPTPARRIIWPILVGILGVAILLLLICCVVIGIRYNRDEQDTRIFVEADGSENGSNMTYVTGVYMDGLSKSKLVVQSPTNNYQSNLRSILQ